MRESLKNLRWEGIPVGLANLSEDVSDVVSLGNSQSARRAHRRPLT